ncbi:MAG TPA: hypothetical protein VGD07_22205 [Methylomirabilota bacterium]
MPFLSQQEDIVATPDRVRKHGGAAKHNWNRRSRLDGIPDLRHERSLGQLQRKHEGEVRRDSGRQGIVSGAHTFDPLAIVIG